MGRVGTPRAWVLAVLNVLPAPCSAGSAKWTRVIEVWLGSSTVYTVQYTRYNFIQLRRVRGQRGGKPLKETREIVFDVKML